MFPRQCFAGFCGHDHPRRRHHACLAATGRCPAYLHSPTTLHGARGPRAPRAGPVRCPRQPLYPAWGTRPHPSTDLTSWDLPVIRTLFTAIQPVDSPANANVWLPLAGDETLTAFQEAVLGVSRLSPEIHLAPNPAAMLAAVSGDPAAVGILPGAWLDDSVRSFDLGIQLPVLITAPQTPTGPALDLAACLQGPVGQTILAERYQPWDASAVEPAAP
jgi:hypothetical protein